MDQAPQGSDRRATDPTGAVLLPRREHRDPRIGRLAMTPSIGSTWIGKTPSGVVVVRSVDGESTVDRPEQGSFREPYVTELHNGQPMVDGTPLQPLGVIAPDFADSCGWYDGDGRELLLTQIPESYFGEPMV